VKVSGLFIALSFIELKLLQNEMIELFRPPSNHVCQGLLMSAKWLDLPVLDQYDQAV
jgi:hypothetical protein